MRKHAPIQRGFTLVELLVVMGILGLLVMLLMPAVNYAIQAAYRASTLNTISHVEAGLAGFHAGFGTYPPSAKGQEYDSSAKLTGYENLAYFLGSTWGGGGAVPSGATSDERYGPYFEGDKLKQGGGEGTWAIEDSFKPAKPIFYFRYLPASTPAYDVTDNPVDANAADGFPSQNNFNLLVLRRGSSQYVRTDYVLISAGPDRKFGYRTGPDSDTAASDYDDAYCDDVTNFQYE